jgi:hypothetical protein
MKGYKDFVANLARNNENRVFLNSDERHALVVLVEIFKQAKDTVRIFAGNLCEHVGNEPDYIEAVSDFIERGGKIRILLNKADEKSMKSSNLFKRLAFYEDNQNDVVVKKTTAEPYFMQDGNKNYVHFTIADENAYRIETDIENRTAVCNMNNPDIAKAYIAIFDEIFSQDYSVQVQLNDMFK